MRDLNIKVTVDSAQAEAALERVDQRIEGVEQSASGAGKATEGFQLSMANIAKAAVVFAVVEKGVETLIRFATEAIHTADTLTRLSDQTGIGVEALQLFQAVGDESGNSLEQITSAITQFQNRFAEGNQDTIRALNDLGLSSEMIRRLAPEQQFMEIAKAVRELPDPLMRTKIAMDIFNRSGAQILPTLRADIDAIAQSTRVMSERSIENWDKLGNTIDRWSRNTKALVGDALMHVAQNFRETARSTNQTFRAFDDARQWVGALGAVTLPLVRELRLPIPTPLAVPGLPAPSVLAESDLAMKQLSTSVAAARKAISDKSDATKRWREDVEASTVAAGRSVFTLNRYGQITVPTATTAIGQNREALLRWKAELPGVTRQTHDWAVAHEHATRSIQAVNQQLTIMPSRARTAAEAYRMEMEGIEQASEETATGITRTFETALGDLNNLFIAAFTGGGGIAGAFQSLATNVAKDLLALIPVVGPFLSQFAGAIVAGLSKIGAGIKNFFKSLFGGPDADELTGRKIVSDYEEELHKTLTATQLAEAGNEAWKKTVIAVRDQYLAMGGSAEEAYAIVERLWASSRQGGDAAQRVVDELRRKMEQLGNAANRAGDAMGGLGDFGFRDPAVDIAPVEMHRGGVVGGGHRGLAYDEVPIIAQRGEGILSRRAMARIGGADGLAALNRGGSGRASVQLVGGRVELDGRVIGRVFLEKAEEARQSLRLAW